jgi:hypothetical protein
MKLCSDNERSDKGPARFSESDFDFLDRVAGAHWDRVRSLLERWFDDHPEEAKRELRTRFIDSDNGQHVGAWWELYIASLFRHLGYDVVPHPTIEGSKRKPDFLVTREAAAVYVECTVAGPVGREALPSGSMTASAMLRPGTSSWALNTSSKAQKNRNVLR